MLKNETVLEKLLNENSYHTIMLSISVLILAAIFFTSQAKAEGRTPQGEFSVIVEQEKTREDFQNEEEMKEFILQEEKVIEESEEK